MTGKGGPTSAPPAINHQRRAQDDAFGVNQRTGKIPACGVHGSHHEGLTIRAARWSTLGRPLVKQCRRANNIPAQGVHGGNHEPLHDGATRVLHEGKFVRSIRCPVLCMRTNQPNQRPPNHVRCSRQLYISLAFSPSFAWWERHCSCSRGTRAYAISTAYLRRRFHDYADNAPHSGRSRETEREPIGLTAFSISAAIMKVASRHEAESKIDVQYYWTWWRCRWPTQWACPRALLEVAALGEKA